MSRRNDWAKEKRRDLLHDCVDASLEAGRAAFRGHLEACHAKDIGLLLWLLQQDLSELHRKRVEESLAWLRASPARTLGRPGEGWRAYYGRLYRAIKGGFYDPERCGKEPSEASKLGRKKWHLKRHRISEYVDARPDWMADANLLPKKPPGK